MKGKSGNLLLVLRENESIKLDGPGLVKVAKLKKNKAIILINADDETTIVRLKNDEKEETK